MINSDSINLDVIIKNNRVRRVQYDPNVTLLKKTRAIFLTVVKSGNFAVPGSCEYSSPKQNEQ